MGFQTANSLNILIGLAIAAVSFLAGQAWKFGLFLYRRRILKKALEVEIAELPPWIKRNLLTCECMVQLAALDEVANHAPVPLPIHVHAEHFPEINLTLSRAERVSINAIYNHAYLINSDIQALHTLNREAQEDQEKMQILRGRIDSVYRNSHHLLLLIKLHSENRNDLERVTTIGIPEEEIHSSQAALDQILLQMVAEARKNGAAWVRNKHRDGAVTVDDIKATAPPIPGKFYYDVQGVKYKCLEVSSGVVTWMQMESKLGLLTVDALMRQRLSSVKHVYLISDSDEIARLERRFQALQKRKLDQHPLVNRKNL